MVLLVVNPCLTWRLTRLRRVSGMAQEVELPLLTTCTQGESALGHSTEEHKVDDGDYEAPVGGRRARESGRERERARGRGRGRERGRGRGRGRGRSRGHGRGRGGSSRAVSTSSDTSVNIGKCKIQ